jgi:hypothetical protein
MMEFQEKKSHFNLVIVVAIPLIMGLGVFALFRALTRPQITDYLIYSEAYVLWANYLLMFASLAACAPYIYSHIRTIPKTTLKKLLVILLFSLILRMWVAPHTHRLYYDEDIYMSIAQNMITDGRSIAADIGMFRWDDYKCCEGFLNKQPNAWPSLVSLVFFVFGVNENHALYLNILLGSLTPLLLFLFVRLFYGEKAGLWSAIFSALMPLHIVWSACMSTEVPLTFFICLAFFLSALHCRENKMRLLFGALMALSLAVQFRPEGVILIPLMALYLIFFDRSLRGNLKEFRFSLMWLVFSFFVAHHAIHVLNFINEPWGAMHGERFGLSNLVKNSRDNFRFFIADIELPALFTAFAVVGLFSRLRDWRQKVFASLWGIFYFTPFLLFYAGSYRYGVDVRFANMILPPFCIMAALGAERAVGALAKIWSGRFWGYCLTAFLLLVFLPHMPWIRTVHEEAWVGRFDHDLIVREAPNLPLDAVIFCHNPHMINVSCKRGSLQSHYGSVDEKVNMVFSQTDNVYFYRDYWCYAPDTRANYEYFLANFDMTVVVTSKIMDREYTLYKVTRRSRDGTGP